MVMVIPISVLSAHHKVSVFLNTEDPAFVAPSILTSIKSADIDLDGDMDLEQLTGSTALWLENNGQGTFDPTSCHRLSSAGGTPQSIAVADVDDDGDVDVLLSQHSLMVTVLNQGDSLNCLKRVVEAMYGETDGSLFLRCVKAKGGAGSGFIPYFYQACMKFMPNYGKGSTPLSSFLQSPPL